MQSFNTKKIQEARHQKGKSGAFVIFVEVLYWFFLLAIFFSDTLLKNINDFALILLVFSGVKFFAIIRYFSSDDELDNVKFQVLNEKIDKLTKEIEELKKS